MTSFVTVVSGTPRSGTSLMMQMLGAGGMELLTDGARRADRDNPRGYFELEAARRLPADAQWLERAVGRAVKLVHVLVPRLPASHRYRIVLMRRKWSEVLASQRAMLARMARQGGEASEATSRSGAVEGLDEERLAGIFAAQLAEVERWAGGRPEAELLCVDYNALVADPLPVARGIASFLEDRLDPEDMAAAVHPSLYRQRSFR